MIHSRFASRTALLFCLTACATSALAQQGMRNGEWHSWRGDLGSTRYSSLDQIDATNAKKLTIAWRWKALPIKTGPDTNYQQTPIMVDGVLYVSTGVHQAAAIDPATGKTLWVFTPEPKDLPTGRPGNSSGRGLAYWTDGKEKRLFRNTLDGRLISIDAKTGLADPKFGKNGTVYLREELSDREVPVLGSTSPPIVVGDIVIAQTVPEVYAPNKEATPGHIRGYDVRTGKRLWTFHTIPQAGEFGAETWENDSWKYNGNTGVWTMMSADPELGYVYLPVETPSHDFYGGHRLGDNLFAESIVCLDAKTGRRVWHYQIVHHGVWDYDLPAAPILGDIVVDGKRIKTVTVLTKQGFAFVFDRVTGEPVWPIEERPVPQSDVPGERLSPTQPFPTKPAPYEQLGYSEDGLIDFTPELREEALEIASKYVRGPLYTPPTRVIPGGTQGTWVQPGYGGGANWNGGAFDPETGYLYVPTKNQPLIAALTPADPKLTNHDYIRAPTQAVQGPRGLPIVRPPWSKITATDMNTGEHVWWRAIGPAPDYVRNHPDLQGLGLDFSNMGYPGIRPSPLVTKTLLFLGDSGALNGDPGGNMLRAYSKKTGAVVAEIELPSKSTGAPMTYMHRGKQYIVIAVSTREHPAELVALALPDENTVPASSPAKTAEPARRVVNRGSITQEMQEQIDTGRAIYAQHCAVCHGKQGEGVRDTAPALSTFTGSGPANFDALIQRIKLGGIQMPPMQTVLTEQQIRDVAMFVEYELGAAER
ncbi:MAG TPA: PQQ-binding-like beta-propeller repeat protein [Steroidobacteraceae bacterium]